MGSFSLALTGFMVPTDGRPLAPFPLPGPFPVDLLPVVRFLLSLRTPYINEIGTKNIL